MLAGRPPFDGETALAVAVQHLKNEPKRLEVLRPDLPEGLCRVVHKMLAKKPEDRYQRAVDLLKELKALKIEGLDQDWMADLPGFNSADLAISSSGRLAATQHLDKVLRNELNASSRRWTAPALAWLILGLLAASLMVGSALAWFNRPPSLLDVQPSTTANVNVCQTIDEQFIQAQLATKNQEAEWLAVSANFPVSPKLTLPENLARKRKARMALKYLGAFYLSNNGRDQDALKVYQQLYDVEPTEKELRLCGAAGLAITHDRLDNRDEASKHLTEVAKAGLSQDLKTILGPFLYGLYQALLESGEYRQGE